MDLERGGGVTRADPGTSPPLYSVGLGIGLAVFGTLDGLVMVVKRLQSPCSHDGTCDPGMPGNGYPHVSIGIAVMAISLLLGIIVHLAGKAVVSRRR